ncbi:hypothetical protein OF83DRAFT_331208 [Amylostereum chailletii]|nr:hypothetical protein OF83DRAFT_331208 [Amylostereum chailletii]
MSLFSLALVYRNLCILSTIHPSRPHSPCPLPLPHPPTFVILPSPSRQVSPSPTRSVEVKESHPRLYWTNPPLSTQVSPFRPAARLFGLWHFICHRPYALASSRHVVCRISYPVSFSFCRNRSRLLSTGFQSRLASSSVASGLANLLKLFYAYLYISHRTSRNPLFCSLLDWLSIFLVLCRALTGPFAM